MIAPCKDCKERQVTLENGKICEKTCEKYKKFRVEHAAEMKKINEKRAIDRMISDCIWRNHD